MRTRESSASHTGLPRGVPVSNALRGVFRGAPHGHIFGTALIHLHKVIARGYAFNNGEGPPGSQMQPVVKGMVQVAGTTFRIVRISRSQYEVVRILDDLRLGSFWYGPTLAVSNSADRDLLREVARSAIQGGMTTWVGPLDLTG